MMRKIFVVVMTLAAAVSMILVGCGSQTNEAPKTISESAEKVTPEPTKAATDAPKKEENEDVMIEDGVIIDENGISVTDMEININTPETASFDFPTNNPKGTDVTFDQTRIELLKEDGTKLDPFANDKEPIDASAQVERHFFNMDASNLRNGDEVSVLFDGEYVTTVIVTGGPLTSGAAAAKPAETTAGTPASENEAPGTKESAFVGDWKLYAMEHNDPGQSITHEQIEEAKSQGVDYSLFQIMTIRENGTYVINMMGEISEGEWIDNGDGTGVLLIDGQEYKIEMDGNLLKGYASDNTSWFEQSEISAV